MKTYFSVALAAILIAGSASAQKVNIGIKGGLNVYNIKNESNGYYDPKTGFNLGLLGHIHLAKQWAFQPELVYSGQGAKYTNNGVETKINLDYINIPLLVQYMFDNGFRLQAGPQVGILAGARSTTGNESVKIKDNLQSGDFAFSLGGGYVNPATGFGIDARYNIGLSNINENSATKSTNRGFQVGLFYLFNHQ